LDKFNFKFQAGTDLTTARPMHRHANIYWPARWFFRCIISAKFRRHFWQYLLKNRYGHAIVLHRVFRNSSCYFVSDWSPEILCPVPYGAQPSDNIKQCVMVSGL